MGKWEEEKQRHFSELEDEVEGLRKLLSNNGGAPSNDTRGSPSHIGAVPSLSLLPQKILSGEPVKIVSFKEPEKEPDYSVTTTTTTTTSPLISLVVNDRTVQQLGNLPFSPPTSPHDPAEPKSRLTRRYQSPRTNGIPERPFSGPVSPGGNQKRLTSCRVCNCGSFLAQPTASWVCMCGHMSVKHAQVSVAGADSTKL